MKAKSFKEVKRFKDIPNIGQAMTEDLLMIGITKPEQLKGKDGFVLYEKLCKRTGVRHDPCVIDVFLAAVDFMDGAKAKPWWDYTDYRKKKLNKK